MASFIQLTHLFNNKKTAVHVNIDQICRIGESAGAAQGYATNLLLANGQMDVCETVAAVMQLIDARNAAERAGP